MPEHAKPASAGTATGHGQPARPRSVGHHEMREHLQHQRATTLSSHERHRMFVRYDNTWWIADPDGYIEITDPSHNAKLDRWQRRLTDGALWT
jgi:hypothetical protein